MKMVQHIKEVSFSRADVSVPVFSCTYIARILKYKKALETFAPYYQ